MANKQSVLKGTMILASTNLIVKIIGAFYTIPLVWLIGAEGIGLYSTAYQIYVWLFIISTTGIPIAISKMVSEELALGNGLQIKKILNCSLVLLVSIGLASSLAMYFGAEFIVNVIGSSKAYLCLVAISPCLLFGAVMSAYRGYFQGMQNMIPTAASELLEAFVRVIAGLSIAYILINDGVKYSAAGAVFGVTLGGFFGMLLLLVIYYWENNNKNINMIYKINPGYSNGFTIITKLIKIAIPITLGASVFSITSVIDLSMIMRRLKDIGFTETMATKMYGYLTGYAYKIYSLPLTVIIALCISIVPLIAAAYINKNRNSVLRIVNTAIRVSLMLSMPAAVGVAVLAEPILKLLFRDTNASQMLALLSVAIVFVSTVQISGAVLQATGKVMLPVKNLLIGAIAKIAINYVLIGIPTINILGAPIGTGISFMIVTALNFWDINKVLKTKIKYREFFYKPLIASLFMGLVVMLSYDLLQSQISNNGVSTLFSISLGAVMYFLAITLIGGITEDDLKIMPFGDKVKNVMTKLSLLKQ